MDRLLVPVLLGTNRQQRNSVHPARWLVGEMEKRPEIQTRLFDVADFAFPHDDYGQGLKDRFPEWRDTIEKADGLVISRGIQPRYPGSLKAVLDLLLRSMFKAVGFVGVSAGPWGGTRVIGSSVSMVRERVLAVTFSDLNFPNVQWTCAAEGKLLYPAYEQRASELLDELVWMSRTLKWGRENVPSKFHPDPMK